MTIMLSNFRMVTQHLLQNQSVYLFLGIEILFGSSSTILFHWQAHISNAAIGCLLVHIEFNTPSMLETTIKYLTMSKEKIKNTT